MSKQDGNSGCDNAVQAADASDSSDSEELRVCTGKRGSPWSPGAGAIPQQAPKLLKRSRQTTVDQGQVPLTYVAGSAKSGVSDTSPPSCQTGQGMGGNLADRPSSAYSSALSFSRQPV